MPAALNIQSNGQRDKRWIEAPVLRVGSGPSCDVRLSGPGIEPHILTIEFRGGRYYVHNRSSSVVQIDGQALAQNSSSTLKEGQIIQLKGGVSIELECSNDPSPSPAPIAIDRGVVRPPESFRDEPNRPQGSFEEPVPETTENAFESKTLLQVGVIGLCMFGMAIMLIVKFTPSAPPIPEVGFVDIAEVVTSAERFNSDWQKHVAKALQRAERARLRNDYDTSLAQLYQVRESLQSPPKGADADFVRDTSGFVKNRIFRLIQQ